MITKEKASKMLPISNGGTTMRAICKVCKDKDSCTYINHNKTGDCIDVQTSDYGYEEAVNKACEWLKHVLDYVSFDHLNGIDIEYDNLVSDLKQAMEE